MNVFCCEGWYEPSSTGRPGASCSAACAKRGRGRRPSRSQAAFQANSPRADDHPRRDQPELLAGVGEAALALGRQRLVGGRGAADGGGHKRAAQLEAVAGRDRLGLVREARAVEGGEQPVARAVPGEDAPGAVAAVRRGGEAEDVDPRRGVAEARHRPAPVLLLGVGGALLARDPLAPLDEARAGAARDDPRLQLLERVSRHRGAGGGTPPDAFHGFKRRPLRNRYCAHRKAGRASAAITASESPMPTSLSPRNPKRTALTR